METIEIKFPTPEEYKIEYEKGNNFIKELFKSGNTVIGLALNTPLYQLPQDWVILKDNSYLVVTDEKLISKLKEVEQSLYND